MPQAPPTRPRQRLGSQSSQRYRVVYPTSLCGSTAKTQTQPPAPHHINRIRTRPRAIRGMARGQAGTPVHHTPPSCPLPPVGLGEASTTGVQGHPKRDPPTKSRPLEAIRIPQQGWKPNGCPWTPVVTVRQAYGWKGTRNPSSWRSAVRRGPLVNTRHPVVQETMPASRAMSSTSSVVGWKISSSVPSSSKPLMVSRTAASVALTPAATELANSSPATL